MTEFKIKPDPARTFYWEVEIYPSVTALRKAPHPHGGSLKGYRDMLACCYAGEKINCRGSRARKMPYLGVIRFSKSHIGVGILSHEVFHATIGYLDRIGIKALFRSGDGEWTTEDEEIAARAQQNMMQQLVNALDQSGLLKRNIKGVV